MFLTSDMQKEIALFRQLGCVLEIGNTKRPDWHRGFITEVETGCSRGRVSFENGKLWGIKWYKNSESFAQRYKWLAVQNELVTLEDWNNIVLPEAKRLQQEAYEYRLYLRALLNAECPKKRRAIQVPNIGQFYKTPTEIKGSK